MANWNKLQGAIAEAKSWKDVENVLKAVEVEDPLDFTRRALAGVARDRLYRAARNESIKGMRAELKELREKVGKN